MVTPIRATLEGNGGGGERTKTERMSSTVVLLPRRERLFGPPHRGFYIVGRTL
jgi:hypothetical protein